MTRQSLFSDKLVHGALLAALLFAAGCGGGADDADAGRFLVSEKAGYGYVTRKGKPAFPQKFEKAADFSDGLAAVRAEGRWGYIRPDGSFAISPRFEDAGDFSGGFAMAAEGVPKRWGVIDSSGNFVSGARFESTEKPRFSQGFARVGTLRDMYFVNTEGRAAHGPFYLARDYKNGFAAVMKDLGYGTINKDGFEVIPPRYQAPIEFSEGLAPAHLDGQTLGYVDVAGNAVIPARFRVAGAFSEGLAPVEENGRVGFIDRTGKMVFELGGEALWAEEFSEGLAAVYNQRQQGGYVDKTGKLVVPYRYGQAGKFRDGLAPVSYEFPPVNAWIDKTGKMVWRRDLSKD